MTTATTPPHPLAHLARLTLTLGLLLTALIALVACKPAEELRKEKADQFYGYVDQTNALLVQARGVECTTRVREAADFLQDKREAMAALIKSYTDFPNEAEQQQIETRLQTGMQAVEACRQALVAAGDPSHLRDFDKELERFEEKYEKVLKKASRMREKEEERRQEARERRQNQRGATNSATNSATPR